MNDTGGAGGLVAHVDGPGAALVGSGREEGAEAQQTVGALDEANDAGLFQAHLLEEHLTVLVLLDLGDFGLGLGGDDEDLRILGGDGGADGIDIGIAGYGGGLIDIADVHDRFVGQEEQVMGHLLLFRVLGNDGTAGMALQQRLTVPLEERQEFLRFLVPARRGLLLHLLDPVFHRLQVLDLQFHVHDFLVPDRVHGTIDMGDVSVVKAAEDVQDGVGFPDVREELVSETLSLGSALHQTGDVHDFHRGGNGALGLADLRQDLQALVRHVGGADIRFDGAERVVGTLGLPGADAVK